MREQRIGGLPQSGYRIGGRLTFLLFRLCAGTLFAPVHGFIIAAQ